MPSRQQTLMLKRQEAANKESSAKANEAWQGDPPALPMNVDTIQVAATEQMAKDIASIYALLKVTSETQERQLNAIQTVMEALEIKLEDMATRLTNAKR